MKFNYRAKESASKLLYANDLFGLPKDISLLFSNIYIRFYKSEEMKSFFYCSLAVPEFKDDEGYVKEMEFCEEIEDENDIDFSTYSCPLNDHNFVSITKDATCYFEERNEMGQRMLLLFLKINGTPFFGYVLFDRSMYIENIS